MALVVLSLPVRPLSAQTDSAFDDFDPGLADAAALGLVIPFGSAFTSTRLTPTSGRTRPALI